ncbi:MAG: type I-F CRISPR-associated endoribonuclease Cas6/Csy4 [Candidatus Nitrosoglobus sp.]|jgi:CRISPR-associated endonuclease Csy4
MFSDYLEIHVRGLPEDTHFILSKLFTRVHGVLKSEALNIGLGFPELKPHSPGSIMRCFGIPRDLERLRCNRGITHLEEQRMILMGPITTVPSEATAIAYRRERKVEKYSAGFRKRQMRRQIRRATFAKTQSESNLVTVDGLEDDGEIERPAYLLLERNGQRLPIHISTAKLQVNPNVCQFNSYGLAKKIEDRYSAVPMF